MERIISRTMVLCIIICFAVCFTQSFAATRGKITGIVKSPDAETLPGANIQVVGTSMGTTSNINGDYVLNLPPGAYTLKVTYIGYQSTTADMFVKAGDKMVHDFELSPEIVKGEVVTVTALAEGQMGAINQELSARNIKNIVSADRIQKVPDVNAAESLGRLPGVSILRSGGEADKVTIRGLSPRFNNILVEGVQMTSTDERNRSVSLASIPSNTLAGIEVTKAITPDMDGNAIGGSVNLKLKEAKEGLHYSLLAQGGYNGHDNKYNDYKLSALVSNRYLENKLGFVLSLNTEQVNRGNDEMEGSWFKEFEKSRPLNGSSLTFRDRKDLRKRLSATLVMDYTLPFGVVKFSNFANRLDKERLSRRIKYPQPGGGTLGYIINETPEIITDQIVNTLIGGFDIAFTELDVQLSHSLSKIKSAGQDWSFDQRGAISQDAATKDGFVDAIKLNQFVNYDYMDTRMSQIGQDTRDTRERDLSSSLNWKIPVTFGDAVAGYLKMGGKYLHKTRDQNVDASFAELWDRHSYMFDLFRAQIPGIENQHTMNRSVVMADFLDNDFTVPNYLGGNYDFPPFPRMDVLRTMYGMTEAELLARGDRWIYNTDDSALKDYNGYEDLKAAYIMGEFNFLNNKLMILPGVRYEHEKHQYTAAYYAYFEDDEYDPSLVPDTTASSYNEFWLPMFHMRYRPLDWLNIRFAQTKTLTRPNFQHITPLRVINKADIKADGGDPTLKPATSWNTDLSFSVFSNYIGLFTVNGFYKNIKNMIWENVIYVPTNGYEEFGLPSLMEKGYITLPINIPDKSTVEGFEIDWQSNFWYLRKPFNGIVFNINYSRINSNTQYPMTDQKRIPGTRPSVFVRIDSTVSGHLEDQPQSIFNFSLGYEIKGFTARISHYWQARTLTSKEREGTKKDKYTEDYRRWDFMMKQDLPWKGLQLVLSANNLTDTPDIRYQLSQRWTTYQEYYGRSFSLGLRYEME